MAQSTIVMFFLVLWLAGHASADGGDDFANNLASDLGPIIALFGERVVMQFMSQAMGIADCILLAVAPIGAITVVVSAIRVAGPAWLKSFIGRARENLSSAEVEVMSSTSKEACELWNGHSVVRCPGSADMYQFVCLLPKGCDPKSMSTKRIRLRCEKLQDVVGGKDGDLLQETEMSGPSYIWSSFKRLHVLESLFRKVNDIYQQCASYYTSLSLQLQIWTKRKRTMVSSRSSDLEAAGHLEQSSVSTQMEIEQPEGQKPSFRTSRQRSISRKRSDRTDSPGRNIDGTKDVNDDDKDKELIILVDSSDGSAPNLLLNCHDRVHRGEIYLAAALSVVLQLGALIFFGIITYRPTTGGDSFLKDGKKIVDYAFPCTAAGTLLLEAGLFICARVVEKSTTETYYKAPNHQMFVIWLQKGRTVSDQVFKSYALYPRPRKYIAKSRRTLGLQDWETTTFLGALVAFVGFVTQFIGIRGLNWIASVIQLGLTLGVTVFRVIVRRGLITPPSSTQLTPENELDWFSSSFGDLSKAPWAMPDDKKATSGNEPNVPNELEPPSWSIWTGGNRVYQPLKEPDRDSETAMVKSAAHRVMVTRQKLCSLTGWKSPVREEAARLLHAIELVAQTFLEKQTDDQLMWTIPATYKGADDYVNIDLGREEGQWHVDGGRLEAILSLWLHSTPCARDFNTTLSHNSMRLYGRSHLWNRLSRDLAWWMPEPLPQITRKLEADIYRAKTDQECVVVGFIPESEDDITGSGGEELLVLESMDKPERIYARDLLFSFIRAVAKMPDVTLESVGIERPKTEAWKQGEMMQPDVDPMSNLARKLEKLGLGTLSDIHFDLIVPFILEGKTGVKDVIDEHLRQAQQYEQSRQWKKLVDTCCSLLNLAQKFDMEKEASGPIAVAVCLEYLCRLRHEAELQRREDRGEQELTTQLEVLNERLESIGKELGKFALTPGLENFLAESTGGFATTFDMLIGATPDATRMFPKSFNIVNEHRELVQAKDSKEPLLWTIKAIREVDSFGWSPLHYAANWQLDNVRILTQGRGDVLSLRDLMGWTPLHYACLKGNKKAVDLLLGRQAPIEVAGHDGITPIHCAVLNGNPRILKSLTEKVKSERLKHSREEMSQVDRNGRLPIHWAAAQGRIDLVLLLRDDIDCTDRYGWACVHFAVIYKHQALLEYITKELSADVNLRDYRSRTPLHLAIEFRSWEAIEALLRAGAEVNGKDKAGSTPLHKAVRRMDIADTSTTQMDIAKRLIESGADVNATDAEGRTALSLAAENGMADVTALLIDRKAKVSIATKNGRTALHLAIEYKHIAKILLDYGAAINAKDSNGYTPLYLAMMNGLAEVAAFLIDRGADVATVAEDGRTPLHMAIRSKSLTEKLLEHGAAIDAKDIEGYTPLYLAATDGTTEVVALLIDKGADVGKAAKDRRTPLHMALSRGQDGLETAKRLLKYDPGVGGHNPYVNAMAKDDATPLHVAAEYGPLEAVEMLLHLGANIDQTDEFGQTALLIAIYNENWDIADWLLKAGADIKADSREGYTPLLRAVMGNQDHIVEQLLRMGADANAVDDDGYSSLHLAVSRGNSTIIRQLLDAGANINAVTELGDETPLHVAVRRGRGEVVHILLEREADTKPLNALRFAALQDAVYRGNLDIVKEFVQHDNSLAPTAPKAALQRGKYGDTPLHSLCRWSRMERIESQMCEMLERLLSVATDIDMINTLNDEGRTPLDLARSRLDESSTLIKKLIDKGAKPSAKEPSEEPLVSGPSSDV
ncbi:ankyrin repeat-containing domain protein [Trichoderma aethiopicum]